MSCPYPPSSDRTSRLSRANHQGKTGFQEKFDGVMQEVCANRGKPIRGRKPSCDVILKTISNGELPVPLSKGFVHLLLG